MCCHTFPYNHIAVYIQYSPQAICFNSFSLGVATHSDIPSFNMFVEFPSIEFILIESKTSSVESWKRMSQVPQPNSSSSQLGMLTSSEPQISGPVHQPLSMSAIISLSVNRQETASAHMLIVAQAMLISPPPQIIRRCKHRWPQTGPVRS